MSEEKKVGKSCVIHLLEMSFTLLNRKNTLIISTPTRFATEGIRRSTVYSVLSLRTCKTKSSSINVSGILTHQFLLIINKLSTI